MSLSFCFFRLNELSAPPPYWAQQLRERLSSHGYTEDNIRPLQGPFTEPQQSLVALLHACERSKEPFALLARLWLMSQRVSRDGLEAILGDKLVAFLYDWGILAEQEEALGGSVDIHPCMGRYFLTDRAIGLQRDLQSVYHLGGDSYALAWLAPRMSFQRGLDLATGSGVHAVLAADHTAEVHAVDISQRAIDFATFNAICNGVKDKIQFYLGDIYQAIPDGRYAFILSNWPGGPPPDEPMELYRSGGVDGEVLIRRMVQGMRERLEVGGWMASYIEYPKYQGQTYIERVREWLGEGSWGIVLMNLKHFTNAAYIMPHVASHSQQELSSEFASWMASYEEAGIQGMGWAMLYVKRLENGPSWDLEVESDFPLTPQQWVADWLNDICRAHQGEPSEEWVPQLHPDVEVWQEQAGGKCRVEWPSRCLKSTDFGAKQARLLAKLADASQTFSDEELESLGKLRKLGLVR